MTTRTIKFYARAYGTAPAEINVSKDGNLIFSGQLSPIDTIFTLPSDPGSATVELFELFQFDVTVGTTVHSDISIDVANSGVLFGPIKMNQKKLTESELLTVYQTLAQSMGLDINTATPEQMSQLKKTASDNNLDRDATTWVDIDSVSQKNVKINNIAQTIDPTMAQSLTGLWHWFVPPGSTFSYELMLNNT
jgi:hypothetical protein